jgi:transposase
VRVDRVLDLGWLHEEVENLYDSGNGRPSIDPEVAVRLMLAGFLLGFVHDRRLMREAQVNLAIRWFCGYGLHETLPDHSSLTRIRQRWGAKRFRQIFERTVRACLDARIAKGEIVHIDASLIRADVSWESLVVRHVEAVAAANPPDEAERRSRKTGKYKKVSTTDPDASMATTARNRRLEPSFKQHTAVDDLAGVVLDVVVTTGEVNEGQLLESQVDNISAVTDEAVLTVTADAGYAYGKVYDALERRGIEPLIPSKAEPIRSPVPLRRFRYDARHDIVKCPQGRTLRPQRSTKHGRFFYSRARDCARCSMRGLCLSPGRVNKAIVIGDHHPSLLRARRRRDRWTDDDRRLHRRHRWRSEGFHGEAKTWHGLARAVRRGLTNMQIQAYLTAAAINLKRLAAALLRALITTSDAHSDTGAPLIGRVESAPAVSASHASRCGYHSARPHNPGSSTAPTCTSSGTRWTTCRARSTTTAYGSSGGSTTGAISRRPDAISRPGLPNGRRPIPSCAPGSRSTSKRRSPSIGCRASTTSTSSRRICWSA